jgi:hypothetical protein
MPWGGITTTQGESTMTMEAGLILKGLVGNVEKTKKGDFFASVFDGNTAHRVYIQAGYSVPAPGEMYAGRVSMTASIREGQPTMFVKQLERLSSAAPDQGAKKAA